MTFAGTEEERVERNSRYQALLEVVPSWNVDMLNSLMARARSERNRNEVATTGRAGALKESAQVLLDRTRDAIREVTESDVENLSELESDEYALVQKICLLLADVEVYSDERFEP